MTAAVGGCAPGEKYRRCASTERESVEADTPTPLHAVVPNELAERWADEQQVELQWHDEAHPDSAPVPAEVALRPVEDPYATESACSIEVEMALTLSTPTEQLFEVDSILLSAFFRTDGRLHMVEFEGEFCVSDHSCPLLQERAVQQAILRSEFERATVSGQIRPDDGCTGGRIHVSHRRADTVMATPVAGWLCQRKARYGDE